MLKLWKKAREAAEAIQAHREELWNLILEIQAVLRELQRLNRGK